MSKSNLWLLLVIILGFVVVAAASLLLVPLLTSDNRSAAQQTDISDPGVHDDHFSSVYIVPKETRYTHKAMYEIMQKKQEWEKQNPNKKIVLMVVVNGHGDNPYYGDPFLVGMLIHYETVAKTQ